MVFSVASAWKAQAKSRYPPICFTATPRAADARTNTAFTQSGAQRTQEKGLRADTSVVFGFARPNRLRFRFDRLGRILRHISFPAAT